MKMSVLRRLACRIVQTGKTAAFHHFDGLDMTARRHHHTQDNRTLFIVFHRKRRIRRSRNTAVGTQGIAFAAAGTCSAAATAGSFPMLAFGAAAAFTAAFSAPRSVTFGTGSLTFSPAVLAADFGGSIAGMFGRFFRRLLYRFLNRFGSRLPA